MPSDQSTQRGFIALTATVILSTVLMLLAVTSSTSSFFARFDVMGSEFKRVSLGLSESCANVALLKIAENYNYSGNETIPVGADECFIKDVTYDNVQTDSTGREVSKKATIITQAQYPEQNGSWSTNEITATVRNPAYSVVPPPTCSLVISSNSIPQGQSVILGWNIGGNASQFKIDRDMSGTNQQIYFDNTLPIDSSTRSDTPPQSATYTATVTGPGGSTQCEDPQSVVVTPSLTCSETVMMLDRTGSMDSSDLNDEEDAANGLLDLYDNLSPLPKTSLGVFGAPGVGEPYNATILQSLTTVYSNLYTAVSNGLSSSGGFTNLASAINKSQEEIDRNASPSKEHVILLLSDGGTNRPNSGLAQDTGLQSPSTTASPDEWSSPSGAFSSNNFYATADNDDEDQGYRSFNFPAIPAGAVIQGIEVKAEAFSSVTSSNTTLFSDSFGSGGNQNDIPNWDEEGLDSDSGTIARQSQSSGEDAASPDGGRFVKIINGEWICRSVNASGLSNVQLGYYWRGDADAEDNERVFVEYRSGGSCTAGGGWTAATSHELDNGNNNVHEAWSSLQSVNLPNNLTGFVRFRNASSDSNEFARIDAVSVAGTGAAPNTSCQLQARIGDAVSWSSYKTATLSSSETIHTLGSPSDDWNNVTWSTGDFTNSNFRVETRFNDPDSNCASSAIASLDHLQARVFYNIPADPYELAYQAADDAKNKGTQIFTIHFGDAGPGGSDQDFLARLASGDTPNSPHEDGSENDLSGSPTTGNTSFTPPSLQAFDTGGDGDGFEVAPQNAFANDGNISQNINGAGDRHRYYGYNFNLPVGVTIKGIEVQPNWWLDSVSGSNSLSISLSWNGGISWTNQITDNDESTSTSNTGTFGSNSNLWGRSAWSTSELSSGNFIVRVTTNSSSNSRDFFLDHIPVRIHYSSVPENTDGDNFFVAPTSADMPGIFDTIGKLVCPAAVPPAPPGLPPLPPPPPPPPPPIEVGSWNEIIDTSP